VSSYNQRFAYANDPVENARVKRPPAPELSSMTGQSITEWASTSRPAPSETSPASARCSPWTRVTSPRRLVMLAQASVTAGIPDGDWR
jgi:hypothetical protein